MTPDYRALCAELIEAMTDDSTGCWQRESDVIDRARAALAEPEAEGPSNEELINMWATTSYIDEPEGGLAFARAVLARWGRPAAAPVPEPGPGEVAELVAWLRENAEDERQMMCESVKGASLNLDRAADLLERPTPQPVPVSERLPGPEDCDAEGRCWRYIDPEESMGNPMWELARSKYAGANYGSVAWLPANALPLPAGEVK